VGRWCTAAGHAVGAVLSLAQAWQLARAWFADRLAPTWRRRTSAETQAVFDALGLRGSFWRLSG